MREVDPNLPAISAMPLSDVTAIERIPQRLAAAVAGTLGIVVLLLAAIGLYGVTSIPPAGGPTRSAFAWRSAPPRRRDADDPAPRPGADRDWRGDRPARGCDRSSVLRSLLFGVSTLTGFVCGIGGAVGPVALIASYLPARRATRVDPMLALRDW